MGELRNTLSPHFFKVYSFRVCFFLILCVISLIVARTIPQYINTGEPLLPNTISSVPQYGWQSSAYSSEQLKIEKNSLILTNRNPEKGLTVWRKLDNGNGIDKLRLEAQLETIDVVRGDKNWEMARLVLLQFINNEPQYRNPHVVAALEGTNPKHTYSKIFSVSPGATDIKVIVQLANSTGTFNVSDVLLHKVVQSEKYISAKRGILAGWMMFFVVFIFSHIKSRGYLIAKILFVVAVVAIVAGTSMPGDLKEDIKGSVVAEVSEVMSPIQTSVSGGASRVGFFNHSVDITKVGHFFLFGILALGLVLLNSSGNTVRILIDVFMLAVGTEILQMFVEGRSALAMDVMIDMGGAVSFLLLFTMVRIVRVAGRDSSVR